MTNILFLIGTILMQSIQMQLSKKQKTFCQFFSAFLEFRLSFVGFEKKRSPHSLCISEIIDCERRGHANV